MGRHRCECGRPAVALPKVKKRSSRATRARKPTHVKDHWLCLKCSARQIDRDRRCGSTAPDLTPRSADEVPVSVATPDAAA